MNANLKIEPMLIHPTKQGYRNNGTAKISVFEYEELIKFYQQKIK